MNLLLQKLTLLPAYFVLVMATGIISIGAFLDDMLVLANILF